MRVYVNLYSYEKNFLTTNMTITFFNILKGGDIWGFYQDFLVRDTNRKIPK